MLTPRRAFGMLLLAVVTTAAVLPCTLLPGAAVGDVEVSMRAKCPCSCSDGPTASSAVTHLDVGVLRAETDATTPLGVGHVALRHPRAPHEPFFARDRIPI